MVVAAVSDLLTMTIPNWLSLALLGASSSSFPSTGQPIAAAGMHFAAGGVVLAVCFVCFALGWIGGGDAKFAAAVALWLGWDNLVEFVVTSALFGGVLSARTSSSSAVRCCPPSRFASPGSSACTTATGVPYGIALAAAALAIYPHTVWIQMVGA